MTDAIITDITKYRLGKGAAFENWADTRILTRVTLLRAVAKSGMGVFGKEDSGMLRMAFPEGFDPLNHPEDNLAVVEAEAVRRGVLPTSQ